MNTATFQSNGGPVIAEVLCGQAQAGSYTVLLWEKDRNLVLNQWHGNFVNTDDDKYPLPQPNAQHDGRLIECLATVVLTPPIQDYRVELQITQDGKVLGSDSAEGKSDQPTVPADLYIALAMQAR